MSVKDVRRLVVRLPEEKHLDIAGLEVATLRLKHTDFNHLTKRFEQEHFKTRPTLAQVGEAWAPLWHELSNRALGRLPCTNMDVLRIPVERTVLLRAGGSIEHSIRQPSPDDFLACLKDIQRLLGLEQCDFRRVKATSIRDTLGYRVLYPEARSIIPALCAIHCHLHHIARRLPLLAALTALVAITNTHPFPDGNGRCSRIIANAVLRAAGVCNSYLSFHDIFWRSGFGWELRVRETEITGNWHGVVDYIQVMSNVLHNIATS